MTFDIYSCIYICSYLAVYIYVSVTNTLKAEHFIRIPGDADTAGLRTTF